MFRRLTELPDADAIAFSVDGSPMRARQGESIAAAMLAGGRLVCRSTPVSGAPRAPYCLMGTCFECLVTIDGRPNVQACQETVRAGAVVETQSGVRAVAGAKEGGHADA